MRYRLLRPETVCFDYRIRPDQEPQDITLQFRGTIDPVYEEVWLERKWYEHPLLQYIYRNAPHGGAYLDIGSHCGNHAVWFGLYMADRVICVEPCPEHADALAHNLRANGIGDYSIMRAAVARDRVRCYDGAERKVRRLRLDDILAEFPNSRPVTLVKIDTDGDELDILRSGPRMLREHRPYLCVEVATPELQEDVPALLAEYGYEVDEESKGVIPTPTWCFGYRS